MITNLTANTAKSQESRSYLLIISYSAKNIPFVGHWHSLLNVDWLAVVGRYFTKPSDSLKRRQCFNARLMLQASRILSSSGRRL